jgi:hypothetical protein
MSRLRVKTLDDARSLFGREIALQNGDGFAVSQCVRTLPKLVIDTRQAQDFTNERVDGAVNISFVDRTAFDVQIRQLSPEFPVYVYGSEEAAMLMRAIRLNVVDLHTEDPRVAAQQLGACVTRNNPSAWAFPKTSWDLVVIGAGVCGAQIATRFMQDNPSAKVLVLDAGNQVGGVLRSLPASAMPEGGPLNLVYRAADMGAMRYFPDAMPVVTSLVTSLGLTPVNIQVTTPATFLYAFGQRNLLVELGDTWTLYGSDPTYNPIAQVESDSEAILAEAFGVPFYDPSQLALYSNRVALNSIVSLSEKSYPALTIPTRSSFAVGIDFDRITGYRGLIFGPPAAAVSLTETVTIGQAAQVSVKEGTQNIVVRMFEELSATTHASLPQPAAGVHIVLGAKVSWLDREGRMCIIPFTGNSGFDSTSSPVAGVASAWAKGAKVAVTTHPEPLSRMLSSQGVAPYLERLSTSFLYFKGLKLFLRYEGGTAWWLETPLRNSGRHLTETYMAQLWFYDDNTLLMYNTGTDSDYWADLFMQKEGLQRLDDSFREFGAEEEGSAWWAAFKTFADDLVDGFSSQPSPTHYALSIYSDQVPIWQEREIGESIIQRRQVFRFPFGEERRNVVWAHNAISIYQGWIEGSLEEANVAYEEFQ